MTTQRELLELQNTTEKPNTNNQQSSQLVEIEIHEGTAFTIVGNQDEGYFVALGKYRITQPKSKEECTRMINEKDYEIILGLIEACLQERDNQALQTSKT